MSAATVIRLRSRFDNSLRSQTSSNSTRSVSSTSFGEKSPISFLAPSDGFGILDSSFHNKFFSFSDRPASAGVRDSGHPGLEFLRLSFPIDEDHRERVVRSQLQGFPPSDAAWLFPEWGLSMVSSQAARRARSEPVLPSFGWQIQRPNRPTPDSRRDFLLKSAGRYFGNRSCRTACPCLSRR